tara:strand:- start:9996 stop:10415 length:420 start_codon:yes stop_codon:yes gene_type:complete
MSFIINIYMSKFEKQFFSLLTEVEDVDALNAGPEDDAAAFDNSLDNPDAAGDFEEVNEPNVDYQADLETLKGWVTTIEGFKTYLNGEEGSVMGRLKAEAKVGTLFDDISDATKAQILDIAERLASLNEQLKNLYTEKHK